jgi:hypothetical protein
MPVILHRNHYATCLTAPTSESKALAELLVPMGLSLGIRLARRNSVARKSG